MSDKENKPITPALANIPEKMGFKGSPQEEVFTKEPQLGLEQQLRLMIMMQNPITDIEVVLEELLQNTAKLAKGFSREDVVKLLEEKYQLKIENENKTKNRLKPNPK